MAGDIKSDDYAGLDFTTGDFQIVTEADEVRQRVMTKILKIFDEDVFNLETGVDWFGIMFSTQFPDDRKELEIRKAILDVKEVTAITRLDYEPPEGDRVMSFRVSLDTEFGPLTEIGG